jgi:hypothetical protein
MVKPVWAEDGDGRADRRRDPVLRRLAVALSDPEAKLKRLFEAGAR